MARQYPKKCANEAPEVLKIRARRQRSERCTNGVATNARTVSEHPNGGPSSRPNLTKHTANGAPMPDTAQHVPNDAGTLKKVHERSERHRNTMNDPGKPLTTPTMHMGYRPCAGLPTTRRITNDVPTMPMARR
jgi:hypothetical protein